MTHDAVCTFVFGMGCFWLSCFGNLVTVRDPWNYGLNAADQVAVVQTACAASPCNFDIVVGSPVTVKACNAGKSAAAGVGAGADRRRATDDQPYRRRAAAPRGFMLHSFGIPLAGSTPAVTSA
jgi:hypothetical protein